jgi:hypothetical protein
MSSTSNRFNGKSATTFADESIGWPSLSGGVARRQRVRGVVADSKDLLACAAAAMARVEREIDHLWRDSMKADDGATSQRLADVSHLLQRAASLLRDHDVIG